MKIIKSRAKWWGRAQDARKIVLFDKIKELSSKFLVFVQFSSSGRIWIGFEWLIEMSWGNQEIAAKNFDGILNKCLPSDRSAGINNI